MRKLLLLISLMITPFILSSCSLTKIFTLPSLPTEPTANVTCGVLSFYLDSTLGSGGECETVPENSSSDIPLDIFIYPAHNEVTIQNYPLTQTQFPPRIWVYPVSRFNELLPDTLPPRVNTLKRIISNRSWPESNLPFLPPIPEAQSFVSHAANLFFKGGKGVRFITEYSESPITISNRNIFYTFQGLTNDGKYWVSVTFPISNPVLPENDDILPEGYTQESLLQNYDTYVSKVKELIEVQDLSSFSPTIGSLDFLVESISVKE